jgi:2-keto-4-pentenoate hydratase
MNDDAVRSAAAELLDMRATHRVEADLPAGLRPAALVEAYAVQAEVVAGLLPAGARTIGFKVACTSQVAQAALRIDEPLFGRLLSSSSHASGATLPSAGFMHRVIEAEFAFRLGSDVVPRPGGHTVESITGHIDAVIPAIEVVDYHYADWTIGALQVAADNAIHGAWVYGDPLLDWDLLDLASAAVTVRRSGSVETTGSGAAVLGHPLRVMAWLADELPRFGLALAAGDVVTTGVTTGVFEAAAGDVLEAEFAGVGAVQLTFT